MAHLRIEKELGKSVATDNLANYKTIARWWKGTVGTNIKASAFGSHSASGLGPAADGKGGSHGAAHGQFTKF